MTVFNLYENNEALCFDHVLRRGDSSSKAIQEHMVKELRGIHKRKSRNGLQPKGSRSTPPDAQVRGIENLVQPESMPNQCNPAGFA